MLWLLLKLFIPLGVTLNKFFLVIFACGNSHKWGHINGVVAGLAFFSPLMLLKCTGGKRRLSCCLNYLVMTCHPKRFKSQLWWIQKKLKCSENLPGHGCYDAIKYAHITGSCGGQHDGTARNRQVLHCRSSVVNQGL